MSFRCRCNNDPKHLQINTLRYTIDSKNPFNLNSFILHADAYAYIIDKYGEFIP